MKINSVKTEIVCHLQIVIKANSHILIYFIESETGLKDTKRISDQPKKSLISSVKEINNNLSSKLIKDYFPPSNQLNQKIQGQIGIIQNEINPNFKISKPYVEANSSMNLCRSKKSNSLKLQNEGYDWASVEGTTWFEIDKNYEETNSQNNKFKFIREESNDENNSDEVSFTLEIEKEDDRQPSSLINPYHIAQKVVPAPSILCRNQTQTSCILINDSDDETQKRITQKKSNGKKGKKSRKSKTRKEATKSNNVWLK